MNKMNNEYAKTILEHNLDLAFLNNKTILFTGAGGLLGRYFVELVLTYNAYKDTKIKIIALDRDINLLSKVFAKYKEDKNLILIEHDVLNPFTVDCHIDYIIHAASPANPYFYSRFPVETINANYCGSLNMLNLAKMKDVTKYIFISSGEVYGQKNIGMNGFSENDKGYIDCSLSRSCYTEGKRASETLAHCFYEEYNVPIIIARLSHTYGPTYSSNDKRVIFQFINNFLDKKDIILKSDGSQIRSYCYVGDTVSALLFILKNGIVNETYNVANNNSKCDIKQLANLVASFSKEINIKFEDASLEERKGYSVFSNAILDGSKLENLGFDYKVGLKNGLLRTIQCKMEGI